MPKNEDGEFELILGNKQVLSVFFIFVILLGVFFTVGYAVGRSSAPVVAATIRSDSKPVEDTVVSRPVETKPEPRSEPVAQPVTTAPQQPPATKAEVKPEPAKEVAKTEPKRELPSFEALKEDKKTETAKPSRLVGEPASGTYLQLSATHRAEAETYVDVLKKKGFSAIAAAHPDNHELFRVLVGPVPQGDLNKTRASLQAAGFPVDKAFPQKF